MRNNIRKKILENSIAIAARFDKDAIATLLPAPQSGGQAKFYNSKADITIFGGAAGSGKSQCLLLRAAKHIATPGYGSVIFRRTAPEITNEGGLWDESVKLFTKIPGARSRESSLDWLFDSGKSAISFGHCQYYKDLTDKYPGASICHIGFDELTKFTEDQFWFLFSRNRSTCGVKPSIDATCNPDANSWVKTLIQWWINPDTGYAIAERSGKLRYFYRIDNEMHWADSAESLKKQFPENAKIAPPLSLTFIRGSIHENKALLKVNPQYLASLMALPLVEREQLYYGNWNIKRDVEGLVIHAFNSSRHIKQFDYDPLLPLAVSFDFNVNPASAIIGQRKGDIIVIFEEIYLNNSNTFESAAKVRLRLQTYYKPYIVYLYGDATGNNRSANSELSNWAIVHNALHGASIPFSSKYKKANPSVTDTLNSTNNLFYRDRLFISPSCTELIRDITLCAGDGKGGINKSDPARTHLLDELRYFCHSEFPYR